MIEPSAKTLALLLRELTSNRAAVIQLSSSPPSTEVLSSLMLRDDCSTEYLKNPCFDAELDHRQIIEYSNSMRLLLSKKSIADTVFIPDELRTGVHAEIEAIAKAVFTLAKASTNASGMSWLESHLCSNRDHSYTCSVAWLGSKACLLRPLQFHGKLTLIDVCGGNAS